MAHFALSYVLRYAGLLQEAAPECDKAIALDPGSYYFRSCSLVFDAMGNTARAMDFLKLDLGSEWVGSNLTLHYLRAGKEADARASTQRLTEKNPVDAYMKSCVGQTAPAGAEATRTFVAFGLADPDPENRYWDAGVLASCGRKDDAIPLLKSAIEGNYCSYYALQSDPLMAPVRGMGQFGGLLAEAKKCQDTFLAQRNQAAPSGAGAT